MNRLWVRLTIAFAVVIAVGLMVATVLAKINVNTQFRRYVGQSQILTPDLLNTLAVYYQSTGSWNGVETILDSAHSSGAHGTGQGQGLRRGAPTMVLADSSGVVVYNHSGNTGNSLTRQEQAAAIPVEVNQTAVGYLLITTGSEATNLTASSQVFLAQINQTMIQAGLIAGLLGTLLGVVIARSLAAPLGRVAAAARRVSQGHFDQRVPATGTTEIADLATAFNQMSAALQQAETLRRNLVADVAHELRTPLTVLQGNLRAILDDVYPLDKIEITRLYDQTRLLSHLVGDLRELAQAEAGQLTLNKVAVNLNSLVPDTVTAFTGVADSAGVTLIANTNQPLPSIPADPARLTQVLTNLLANALRHTPAGGTITVQTGATVDHVWLTVQDTGEGIAAADLPHLFDRFYRAAKDRSRATGGSGLGLAIVSAIVEAHGGQVTAASAGIVGQGSVFTVLLPL